MGPSLLYRQKFEREILLGPWPVGAPTYPRVAAAEYKRRPTNTAPVLNVTTRYINKKWGTYHGTQNGLVYRLVWMDDALSLE